MNKRRRRRPWGLMGLIGLGGAMLMSTSREDSGSGDDTGGGGGSGGGSGSGDDSGGGGGGSGGDPSGGGGSGDDPGGGGSSDDPGGGGGSVPLDLPPPPLPTDDGPDPLDPPLERPDPEPAPRPTRPGTTDGPRPPIAGDDDDDDPIELPPPVFPPTDDGPPFTELVDPYPRGGVFYQVVRDDRFGGTSSRRSIAYRYLLSEAYLAATEVGGMPREDALQWAVTVAKQDKVRLAVIDLFQCSGWNDALYGADPVRVSHASAHGRSILLRPVHGPTAQLLEQGQTPVRNITMAGNPADSSLREYELLWSPALDRVVLWDSGGQVVTTTGMTWADGSSMENPPPWVMALGLDDNTDAMLGAFGCPGTDGELEVS